MEQKTVFISYRRALSRHLARSIYQDLKMNGWDVFLDVNTIDSGDFDRIILNQIGARAHFILLISQDTLKRCANADDWVLREILEAIRLNRNIVPIVDEGVDFIHEIRYLPEKLRAIISKKNTLPLHHFYFDDGMSKLRTRFLKTPEYVKIASTPPEDRDELKRRLDMLDEKLETSSEEAQYPFEEGTDYGDLEIQNIFDLLGREQDPTEEKEEFLDELQERIWQDFLNVDAKKLLTQEEFKKYISIKEDPAHVGREKDEQLLIYFEECIPDFEDITMDKALDLKARLVYEHLQDLKKRYADNQELSQELTQAEKLIIEGQWENANTILKKVRSNQP